MMDIEIAERMKNENNEQFHTLVRMHLSFELDLNTTDDDNEIPVNEKNKIKKLFKLYLHPKGCVTNQKSISPACNGHNNSITTPTLSNEGIQQINQLIDFLMDDQNVCQEGIFRRTGSVTRQHELKLQIQGGKSFQLFNGNIYSVHDCASVLKGILAELPEPLLTDMYFPVHCQIAELYKNTTRQPPAIDGPIRELRLLNSLQLLLLLLPTANYRLFKDIIKMLNHTIKFESNNKMSANSLATLFTPHIICPRKLTPEALHTMSQAMYGIISFMITKGLAIFDIPQKLSTDIRAYFIEQNRKRTMSPEQFLDESVTSDSTANTVFTFVDREKTAKAHDSNPTDTALAQLYAHIQSLPESSKKRKLIKQFNKENGQGTPLQFQISHRLKNSTNYTNINCNNNNNNNNPTSSTTTTSNTAAIGIKSTKSSLGDSIKKHIFSRGPKTPKQQQQRVLQTTSNNNKITNQNAFNDCAGAGTTLKGRTSSEISTSKTTPFDTPNNRRNINKNLKTRVLFQSPLYNINKSSSSSSPASASSPSPAPESASSSSSQLLPTMLNDSKETHKIVLIDNSQQNLLQSNCTGIQNNDNQRNGGDILTTHNSNKIIKDDCLEAPVIKLPINNENNFDLLKRKSLCKSESYLDNLLMKSNEIQLITDEIENQCDGQAIKENNSNNNDNTKNDNDKNNNKLSFTLKLRRAISLVNVGIPKMSFHKSIMKKSISLQSKFFVSPSSSSPLLISSKSKSSASFTLSSSSHQHQQQQYQQQYYQLSKNDRMCSPLTYQKIYDYNLITNNNNTSNNNSNNSNNNSSDNQNEMNPIINPKTSPVSPITKSTQRMSRSMQESIMTPRCRKPVMFFSTIMGSSGDQQQHQHQHHPNHHHHHHPNHQHPHSIFTSVRELDEPHLMSTITNEEEDHPHRQNHPLILNKINLSNNQSRVMSLSSSSSSSSPSVATQLLLYKSKSETDLLNDNQYEQPNNYNDTNDVFNMISAQKESAISAQLSQPFREYLYNRNVLMTSPVDSSFSSHPDDFGSNNDIQNLSETDMSESLLYCLNGNRPSMTLPSMTLPDDSSLLNYCDIANDDDEHDVRLTNNDEHFGYTNNNNNNNKHIGMIVDNLRKRHHTFDDELLRTNKITDRLANTTSSSAAASTLAAASTSSTSAVKTTTTTTNGDEKMYAKKGLTHQQQQQQQQHYSNHCNQHHIRHHHNHHYLQSNQQQHQQQRCNLDNSIGETSL